MKTLNFEDFDKLDFRVGTIIEVNEFPEAHNPSYKLTIDFGDLGIKQSSAQLTARYTPKALLNLQVIALLNIPILKIDSFESECLVLGATNEKDVFLVQPESRTQNGALIS